MFDPPYHESFSVLLGWAEKNETVRAMALTGSRAAKEKKYDILSDFDIELFVNDLDFFLDDRWLDFLGGIMIRWPAVPACTFSPEWLTRLVLLNSGVRFDFQITLIRKPVFYRDSFRRKILVDKDNIFAPDPQPPPTDKNPGKQEFESLVNDFLWDATYVAKALKRDELFFAKYMLENGLRFGYLEKILNWHIGLKSGWKYDPGIHGRHFKKYLSPGIWTQVESTFSGPSIEENWKAFFNLWNLFRQLAHEIASRYKFNYPDNIDSSVYTYCLNIKSLDESAAGK